MEEIMQAICKSKQAQTAKKAIALAIESDSLSKGMLRELAQKYGLEATQEAVVACSTALEKECELKLRTLDKCMGVLFSPKTAKKLGVPLPR
jgi:hypothetical protein